MVHPHSVDIFLCAIYTILQPRKLRIAFCEPCFLFLFPIPRNPTYRHPISIHPVLLAKSTHSVARPSSLCIFFHFKFLSEFYCGQKDAAAIPFSRKLRIAFCKPHPTLRPYYHPLPLGEVPPKGAERARFPLNTPPILCYTVINYKIEPRYSHEPFDPHTLRVFPH